MLTYCHAVTHGYVYVCEIAHEKEHCHFNENAN